MNPAEKGWWRKRDVSLEECAPEVYDLAMIIGSFGVILVLPPLFRIAVG